MGRAFAVYTIRAVYTLPLLAGLLYLGAGDFRAFLLCTIAALTIASFTERALQVSEAIPTLVHLLCMLLAGATFTLYSDGATRGFVALCVVVSLIGYAVLRHEVESAETVGEEGETSGEEAASS